MRGKRIYQEVAEEIKKWILEGKFSPGSRLPSEGKLIEELGISRPSLREAFRVLESMGLVEMVPGKGRFVRNIVAKGDSQVQMLQDALVARESIEPVITKYAAEVALDNDIDSIFRVINIVDERKDLSYTELLSYDKNFHLEISKATHNFLFVRFTLDYLNIIGDLRKNTLKLPGRKEQSFKEHKAIFQAIKEHDGVKAYEAALTHIRNIRRIIELLYVNRW